MLTVLFATRNGAGILPRVLDAYRALESPAGGWRLVVVDNASHDATAAVLGDFRATLPLTVLSEATQGKNNALNTGVAEVSGDLVVLTDDDAIPHPDWLVAMRAAADAHQDHAIFGGVVLPRWERTPEPWLTAWVPPGPVFTLTDPAAPEGPTGAHNVFGPNMAVRRDVFEQGYRFNADIGPRRGSYAMGSETDFVRRLLHDGFRAWHVRGAVVEHVISSAHMTSSWILKRAVRFGRGQYRLAHAEQDPAIVRWFGIPRHLFRELLTHAGETIAGVVTADAEGRFRSRWATNYTWGQMLEARRIGRENRSR